MSGKQYNCVTFGFRTVGAEADVFTMKDITPDSFADDGDILQLLESENARTVKTYFAYDGGWYEDVDMWNDANDDQFDCGTGFLGNFISLGVKLTPAGQVLQGPSEFDFTSKQYNMIGNPLPRAVKFSEIEPVSFADDGDILQRLEPENARTVQTYFAFDGDWYEDVDLWNDASDDEFAVGEAMLGNFISLGVKLNFPGAL